MSHCRLAVFLAVLILSFSCLPARAAVSQQDLKNLTEQALAQGKVIAQIKPMFNWDAPMLMYNLGQVELGEDTWSIPLRAQYQVTLIRQSRTRRSQRRFWRPILHKVEEKIEGMLTLIQQGNLEQDQLNRELMKRHREIDEMYERELNALAQKNGKTGAQHVGPKALRPTVTFKTKPPKGRIQIRSAGEVDFYNWALKNNRPLRGWKPRVLFETRDGEQLRLYGAYVLNTKWPNGSTAKNDQITVLRPRTIHIWPN